MLHFNSKLLNFWILFSLLYLFICCDDVVSGTSGSPNLKDSIAANADRPTNGKCPLDDISCQKDSFGFEAIAQLHSLIDDDHDGGLDRSESEEFFREDLKHDRSSDNFHQNDDFITVYDLWRMWHRSEVYNWTVDDVLDWLTIHVELPQYTNNFREKLVDGRVIPRFVSTSQQFANSLGIKNAVHKQKLSIKATDLVLFGLPKSIHSFKKDLAVILSLIIGAGGCYFAYRQQRTAQSHIQKVMKDLASLQHAEDALTQVQQELEKAQREQQIIADDKQNLEKRLKDEIRLAKAEAEQLKRQRDPSDDRSELKVVEEELMKVRLALFEAERRLEENQYVPLYDLQLWLQLTYEIEKKYFEAKRDAAQAQLQAAKEMWEKIRKQKGKFLGSFRVAHTTSLDETDQKIMNVRASLESVKLDLQERIQRWNEIEKLCHFSVSSNPGMEQLHSLLKDSNSALDKIQGHARSQSGFSSLEDVGDFHLSTGSPMNVRKASHSKLHCSQLRPIGSEENIGRSMESIVASSDGGDPARVVFDLGTEIQTKLSSSQLVEKSKSLKPDSSMTKSRSFTVDTRSGTLPNTRSSTLPTSIVTSQSMDSKITKDGQPRPLHDGHPTRLDPLLDDGNSSDSSSHDPERKKKSGLFKIFKHKEK